MVYYIPTYCSPFAHYRNTTYLNNPFNHTRLMMYGASTRAKLVTGVLFSGRERVSKAEGGQEWSNGFIASYSLFIFSPFSPWQRLWVLRFDCLEDLIFTCSVTESLRAWWYPRHAYHEVCVALDYQTHSTLIVANISLRVGLILEIFCFIFM